jgi:hypothetical protein
LRVSHDPLIGSRSSDRPESVIVYCRPVTVIFMLLIPSATGFEPASVLVSFDIRFERTFSNSAVTSAVLAMPKNGERDQHLGK